MTTLTLIDGSKKTITPVMKKEHDIFNNPVGRELLDAWVVQYLRQRPKTTEQMWANRGKLELAQEIKDLLLVFNYQRHEVKVDE